MLSGGPATPSQDFGVQEKQSGGRAKEVAEGTRRSEGSQSLPREEAKTAAGEDAAGGGQNGRLLSN